MPLRLLVFYVEGARAAREGPPCAPGKGGDGNDDADDVDGNDGGVPLTVLINPLIQIIDPTPQVGMEACLSLPELAGEVPRASAILYRGLTLDGSEIVREARGFHARVVQHECDHLDGILFPQRMTDLSRLTFTSELERRARRAPEAAEG